MGKWLKQNSEDIYDIYATYTKHLIGYDPGKHANKVVMCHTMINAIDIQPLYVLSTLLWAISHVRLFDFVNFFIRTL